MHAVLVHDEGRQPHAFVLHVYRTDPAAARSAEEHTVIAHCSARQGFHPEACIEKKDLARQELGSLLCGFGAAAALLCTWAAAGTGLLAALQCQRRQAASSRLW